MNAGVPPVMVIVAADPATQLSDAVVGTAVRAGGGVGGMTTGGGGATTVIVADTVAAPVASTTLSVTTPAVAPDGTVTFIVDVTLDHKPVPFAGL